MAFSIRFNEEKNQLVKSTRGIGFDEVKDAIEKGKVLADITHPSPKHPNQLVYVIEINNYAYVVPYVINHEKQEIFLKTIYPSRVFTKKYVKGGENEKNKK